MNDEFYDKAYEKAIVAELRRYLVDTFVPYSATQAKASLICEDVPYAMRIIPVKNVIEVVTLLQEREERLEREMAKFVVRRKSDVIPFGETEASEKQSNKKTKSTKSVSGRTPKKPRRSSRSQHIAVSGSDSAPRDKNRNGNDGSK